MSTTPKYKLTYFNVTARAEPIRLILAAAGVKYEDVRIKREDWPKMKPSKNFMYFIIMIIETLISIVFILYWITRNIFKKDIRRRDRRHSSNVRFFKEIEKKWGMFILCYVFGQLSSVKRLAKGIYAIPKYL